MLTDEQKKDLETRNGSSVSARRRADIVHRFTGKLKDRLDGLKDINYLLNELPSSSVKNTVSYEHVYLAFELVKKLLEIIDPIPVIGEKSKNPQYKQRYVIKDVRGLRGMMYYPEPEKKIDTNNLEIVEVSFPATEEEVTIFNKLDKHSDAISSLICSARSAKRGDKHDGYTLPEFSKIINDIAAKRGQIYQIKTVYSSAEVVGDKPKPGDYASLAEIDETINGYLKKEYSETKT